PTLTVMVDDQPVNSALVGVSRPVNPGSHRVSASAPGYTKAERQVDLKEKQKLEVALTLVSTGGVVYGPTGTDTTGGTTTPPAGSSTAAVTTDNNPPSTMPPPPPADTRSKMSIFLGPRLGLMVPFGSLPVGTSTTAAMSDVAGPGAALGIEGGLRIARILFFSLIGEASGYSGTSKTFSSGSSTYTSNVSSSSVMGGGKVGIISNPEGFGFFGSLGAGFRYFKATASNDNQNGGTTSNDSSWQGIDYTLGLGMHFKAGKYVRLVPLTELTYGVFSSNDPNVSNYTSGTGDGSGSSTSSSLSSASDTAGHFFFFLGMGGYFDIDLDKPKPAAASPSTPAVTAPSAPPSADIPAPAAATP
ncbi:MAG: PEGA domain-containing protein, partial [Polyangiaceae bacterium]